MLALSPVFVRPFTQSSKSPSPMLLSSPAVFFLLPDSIITEPIAPVLIAVTLPSELSDRYQLSELLVFADTEPLLIFSLLDQPFLDTQSGQLVWLFAGFLEPSVLLSSSPLLPSSPSPLLTLFAQAFFDPIVPTDPSSPSSQATLTAFDSFIVTFLLPDQPSEPEEDEDASPSGDANTPDEPSPLLPSSPSPLLPSSPHPSIARSPIPDPIITKKVIEQDIAAKALSKAKKNKKSTAKGKGIIITVGAYPDVLPADGKSTAFIVAKVTNESGKPLSGKGVSFSSTGGKVLLRKLKTDKQGLAISRICSEVLPKGKKKVVKVKAKTNPEAETMVTFVGGQTTTLSSSVTVYSFAYWKKETPNGIWICTPKQPYCETGSDIGVSGLAGIALHIITPLGYWYAHPNYVEVIGDKHPGQSRSDYERKFFDYDQNAPCPPPPDPNNPNQQRFRFSWQPLETLDWSELHRSESPGRPITIKINYTVGRSFPPPSQFWTETKVFTVNAFNAVLQIEPNSPKILMWDPENPDPNKLTVNFSVNTLQKGRVWVWMDIYACDRANGVGPIRVIQKEGRTNTTISITWDGSLDGEVAEKGLYAYDLRAFVEQLSPNYFDKDKKVSKFLTIERAVDESGQQIFDAEYYGYDDKGTEDESDDDHLYFLKWYVLKETQGRDASSGEVWLYDPDLIQVGTWDVASLKCLEHGTEENPVYDGLKASSGGTKHGILVPVPVSLMQKAGTYRFALHFKDGFCPNGSHSDRYKDHKEKPALEVNQTWSFRLDEVRIVVAKQPYQEGNPKTYPREENIVVKADPISTPDYEPLYMYAIVKATISREGTFWFLGQHNNPAHANYPKHAVLDLDGDGKIDIPPIDLYRWKWGNLEFKWSYIDPDWQYHNNDRDGDDRADWPFKNPWTVVRDIQSGTNLWQLFDGVVMVWQGLKLGTTRYKVVVRVGNQVVRSLDETDVDDYGPKQKVRRIVSMYAFNTRYLRWCSTFLRVNTIYASVYKQVDRYIGGDCADVAVIAYRKMNRGDDVETSRADGLSKYDDWWADALAKTEDYEIWTVKEPRAGDLVLIDIDDPPDGRFEHTTIFAGNLDPDDPTGSMVSPRDRMMNTNFGYSDDDVQQVPPSEYGAYAFIWATYEHFPPHYLRPTNHRIKHLKEVTEHIHP